MANTRVHILPWWASLFTMSITSNMTQAIADARRSPPTQPNPGQPDGRYEAPNVVTAPGLVPTGNRHERRKAAALKRRRG